MIYVIESSGNGDSNADYVMLRTFLDENEAYKYITPNTKKYSDGHKYWTRFDIVKPGVSIEPFAE